MIKKTRKVATLVKNGMIKVFEEEYSPPSFNEVEVTVSKVGICSSDIERGFKNGAYHYPLVMGHEISGVVSKVPYHNKNTFKEGDKVTVFPLLPCFECISCKRKIYALCKKYSYYGSRCDGGFSTHLNCKEWNLMKLPDNIIMDDAALVDPTAVVIHAVKKLMLGSDDKRVCIIGAGFLGLIAVMYIRYQFPQVEITLIDRNHEKIKYGNSLGANGVVLKNNNDWDRFIFDNKDNFKKVIEFIGTPETFCYSINLCQQGGVLVWVGNITGDMEISKQIVSSILRKELSILGSWNSVYKGDNCCDWEEAITLMTKGFCPSKLVTTKIGIDEIHDTILKLYNHKKQKAKFKTIKAMVDFG